LLYGGNMALIDYDGIPSSRGDVFIHSILATLNGAEVGGIGKFSFENDLTRYNIARATVGNSRTFTGVQIFLATKVGDTGVAEICNE